MGENWISYVTVALIAYVIGNIVGRSSAKPKETPTEFYQRREENISALSATARAEVEQLIRDKKIIAAVRAFREHTGKGLKESKEAVDEIRRQIG
jgi:ribosomal protein L7/L12